MKYNIKLALFSSKHFHEYHYFHEYDKNRGRKKCNISAKKAEEISTSFKKMFHRRHKYAKFRRRHMNVVWMTYEFTTNGFEVLSIFLSQNPRKMR